jgi:hypothetical protein
VVSVVFVGASPAVKLVLNTYELALKLAKDIKDGKLHLAKEMTVVAASCLAKLELSRSLHCPLAN